MLKAPAHQGMTPDDLAELMDTFQDVTLKLQSSHDQLTSEVRRLKSELRDANDALERSRRLAALGEMAAGIAHEIRNPLAAISLDAASLASETCREQQTAAAHRITFAVKTLNAIVQDVLAFAGDARVRATSVDAAEACMRAVDECLASEEEGSAGDIRVELGPWEEMELWCDPHLVHRALVNIIRNAVDAMRECEPPEGGHVLSVRTARVEARSGRRGHWSALVVADTGPGMSQSVVERMFNPFFTTRATGTGLGLAIVHRIGDAHGGRVEVQGQRSDGVRGAEVRLVLPGHDAAAEVEAA